MAVKRVAIIGGGISGLSAAYYLEPYALAGDLEVHLFERQERLGGVIETDTSQGVVLEGGPESLVRRKPEAADLCRALGLGAHLIGTNPKARGAYIFHRDRLHPIPAGVAAGVPTDLQALWRSGLLSWTGKARATMDLVLPRSREPSDRGLGQLLAQRFGRELVNVLAEPLLSGIYAGRADDLSTAATFPQLLEYQAKSRSLILAYRQARASTPTSSSPAPSMFLTLDQGMATMVDALLASLKTSLIHLGLAVTQVKREDPRWRLDFAKGQSLLADVVIAATPAYVTADLIGSLSLSATRLLQGIDYANLAVVVAVYDPKAVPMVLDGTGFLVPRGEGLQMTACTWTQTKWATPSPRGVPMRMFFGRAGGEDVTQFSDDRFHALVLQEAKATMGIGRPPDYFRVFRWPRAMPQYGVGHAERIWQIRQALSRDLPGLFVAGSALQGVGVSDCIRQARQATDAALEHLGVHLEES